MFLIRLKFFSYIPHSGYLLSGISRIVVHERASSHSQLTILSNIRSSWFNASNYQCKYISLNINTCLKNKEDNNVCMCTNMFIFFLSLNILHTFIFFLPFLPFYILYVFQETSRTQQIPNIPLVFKEATKMNITPSLPL